MATQEQIETLLEQLEKAPPSAHFQRIDKNAAGIQAILKYLSETDEQVTAGDISDHLNVSTARVAVLLKKMDMLAHCGLGQAEGFGCLGIAPGLHDLKQGTEFLVDHAVSFPLQTVHCPKRRVGALPARRRKASEKQKVADKRRGAADHVGDRRCRHNKVR